MDVVFRDLEALNAGLPAVIASPKDDGRVELIVRRPAPGEREVIAGGELDPESGLAGDSWRTRKDISAGNPEAQVTLINTRAISLLAGAKDRWSLAGDQFYVDMDLSEDNLPPGTQLSIGTAVLRISTIPHTGCAKFDEWYGKDARNFVTSKEGLRLRLRGVYAMVTRAGMVKTGDALKKIRQE